MTSLGCFWGRSVASQIGDRHLDVVQTSFACDSQTARVIAGQGEERLFEARALIIRAGDRTHHAWMLLEGSAQAIAFTGSGQHVLVHGFGPGDLFGEIAGASDIAGDTEVRAVSHAALAKYRQIAFIALMENYSCVALAVTRQLTRRLTDTTRRMIEVATLSTSGRIHSELLRRARLAEDLSIRPAPVLSEFALDVQSTRETVSRTISQLEKRGIIVRTADRLRVVAPHRLEELIY